MVVLVGREVQGDGDNYLYCISKSPAAECNSRLCKVMINLCQASLPFTKNLAVI